MEYREKIEYLSQLRLSSIALKNLMEEREKWYTLGTKVNSASDGMPHSPSTESKVEKSSIKILEITEKINEEIARLTDARFAIGELINHIQNDRHRTVMSMRYISCYTFSRIAEDLDMSERAVYKIHRKAVNRLEIGDGREKKV